MSICSMIIPDYHSVSGYAIRACEGRSLQKSSVKSSSYCYERQRFGACEAPQTVVIASGDCCVSLVMFRGAQVVGSNINRQVYQVERLADAEIRKPSA